MIVKKYLDMDGLCEHTTLSRSVIYKLMKDKEARFPTPYTFKFIDKRVVWLVTEVDEWFARNTQKQVIAG